MSDTQPNHLEQLKLAEERDQEWLKNVYRGDKERDLTPRAIIAGMIFGGLMSLSNLYVGLKSGWGLGVDIAAVIVIFAVFKALRGAGLVKDEIGMQENTIVMTVSVAASWISSAPSTARPPLPEGRPRPVARVVTEPPARGMVSSAWLALSSQ